MDANVEKQRGGHVDVGHLQLGSIVWAKFGKNSYWPAVVITEDLTLTGLKPRLDHVCVFWLSSLDVSQVKTCYVKPFHFMLRRQSKQMSKLVTSSVCKALQIQSQRGKVDLEGFDSILDWGLAEDGYLSLAQACPQRFDPPRDDALPGFVMDCLKRLDREAVPDYCDGNAREVAGNGRAIASKEKESERRGHLGCMGCSSLENTNHWHPLFEGRVCEPCKDRLEISLFATDTDGSGNLCTVCGLGGKLIVCDKCTRVYCSVCIIKHTSRKALKIIEETETWDCFLCTEYDTTTHGSLKKPSDLSIKMIKFSEHDYVQLQWKSSYSTMFTLNAGTHYLLKAVGPLCALLPHGFSNFVGPTKRNIRVLSLYDGIGTGKVILDQLGLIVDKYYALEVDRRAIAVSSRVPGIQYLGNVSNLTTEQLEMICPIDLVLGGPPCDDLSLVNHDRKGFNGSAIHTFRFVEILLEVQRLCQHTNHVFYLMENSGNMPNAFRDILSSIQSRFPAIWDAKYFTGMRRRRFFWGNIPGLQSTPLYRRHLEQEKTVLADVVQSRDGRRKASVTETRTITTSRNSLTIHSGKKESVVTLDGKDDLLYAVELEKLFGFPTGYTDRGRVDINRRRKLMGRAWSVQVVREILLPLRQYYLARQD